MTTYVRSDDFARANGVDEGRVIEAIQRKELRGKSLGHYWFVESWQRAAGDGERLLAGSKVPCRECGGPMRDGVRVERNRAAQLLGVALFAAGLWFALSGFGLLLSVAGIALAFAAFQVGHRRRNLWICERCGYHFERIEPGG